MEVGNVSFQHSGRDIVFIHDLGVVVAVGAQEGRCIAKERRGRVYDFAVHAVTLRAGGDVEIALLREGFSMHAVFILIVFFEMTLRARFRDVNTRRDR